MIFITFQTPFANLDCYTDDKSLLILENSFESAVSSTVKYMNSLQQSFSTNQLQINYSKTNVILFKTRMNITYPNNLTFNSHNYPVQNTICLLDVMVDDQLNMQETKRLVYKALQAMRPLTYESILPLLFEPLLFILFLSIQSLSTLSYLDFSAVHLLAASSFDLI